MRQNIAPWRICGEMVWCRWVREGLGHESGEIRSTEQSRSKYGAEVGLRWEGELDRLILIASAEGVWGDGPQKQIRCGGGEKAKARRRRRWRWRPGVKGWKGKGKGKGKGKCVALLDNPPASTEVSKKSVDAGTATCCNVRQNNNLPILFFAHCAPRLRIHWTGAARQLLR